ncbi:MAG TPA: DUF2218 domain-containing protein [Pseudonocardiaceae bacterium]|nr:DUF2218 domain-containing protein [Pseudonocardiaceae bacterium]
MPTAEAQVRTDRASRYLVQLCRHLGQMSRMRHQMPARHGGQAPSTVEHADWSDTTGTIRFTQGTCTLQATDDALTLRVAADDEDTLRQLQQGIARRLDTIGRRDQLTVHWQQSTTVDDPPREDAHIDTAVSTDTGRRRTGGLLAIVAIAALAILLHIGILGATLAASAWASWGTNIVLAIIAVKIITVVLHGVLGRAAFRRRGAIRHWIRGHRTATGHVASDRQCGDHIRRLAWKRDHPAGRT